MARTFALASPPVGGDVWSPVLRRRVKLAGDEAPFLDQFAGGIRPVDHLSSLTPGPLADFYLGLQRYLLLGVLVEKLILTSDEVGALQVGATPDELTPTGTVRAGADTAAVRDLCDQNARPAGFEAEGELRVCRRPGGGLVLLDGLEAACTAYVLGRSQPVEVLQRADFVRRVVDVPGDFFGTMRGGIPYQSVCCDGEELVRGRRRALYDRLDLVRPTDLIQRAVLDLGCNIGMNCYLAVERGASRATGVDRRELVSAAAQLNGFYGRPCRFVAADVSRRLDGLGPHDTVFLFSVLGHLDSIDPLLQTIERVQAGTIYVETHREGEPQGELDPFLAAPCFRQVDFVGYCENSALEEEATRRMFRCEVGTGPV